MLDDLVAATRAYRAAQERVTEVEQELAAAKDTIPQAREALHAAIVRAALSGARQGEIVAITGYNRETVRRILRAAGVEAES